MKFTLFALVALSILSSCTKTVIEPTKIVTVTDTIIKTKTKIDTVVKTVVEIVTDTVVLTANEKFLIGSWQMVSNSSVDVTFDIVANANGTIISTTNAKVTYNGISSAAPPYTTAITYNPASDSYDITLWSVIPFDNPQYPTDTNVSNAARFFSMQLDATNLHLTNISNAQVSYASVTGYNGTLANNIIYFTPPVVLNKVK